MTDNGRQMQRVHRKDYRHSCGRLLFRGFLPPGSFIALRCPRCNLMHVEQIPYNGTTTTIFSTMIQDGIFDKTTVS